MSDELTESERLVRRTDLMFLPQVAEGLRQAFLNSGVPADEWELLCAGHVTARCTICDHELSDEEWARWLLQLGVVGPTDRRPMKFLRLEKGTCSNLQCHSRFYHLTFTEHPTIDWASVCFGRTETKEPKRKSKLGKHLLVAAMDGVRRQLTLRLGVGLGVLLLLWILRQYYTGGEIPVIRPAKYYEGVATEPTNQFHLDDR